MRLINWLKNLLTIEPKTLGVNTKSLRRHEQAYNVHAVNRSMANELGQRERAHKTLIKPYQMATETSKPSSYQSLPMADESPSQAVWQIAPVFVDNPSDSSFPDC